MEKNYIYVYFMLAHPKKKGDTKPPFFEIEINLGLFEF